MLFNLVLHSRCLNLCKPKIQQKTSIYITKFENLSVVALANTTKAKCYNIVIYLFYQRVCINNMQISFL